jgi:cysteinyl-tRNA synthetase
MNITDLDDRTISASHQAGMDLKSFTEKYIKAFLEDIKAIGIKPASQYPRASEHIEDMVDLVRRLLKKGVAYEKLQSVYFDISRFSDYGKLSRIDLNKIRLGSTTDLDDYEKDNPRDFTLLKRTKLSELKRGIYTKTEWGNIRPGWHIECAAMAMKYLGESFDIHTSNRGLIFPHHENEIAISESVTGKPMARYWLHSAQVLTGGKNVGSVEKNRVTVRGLMDEGYTGRELRFWFISNHYRKPLHFSYAKLQHARSTLFRLDQFIERLQQVRAGHPYPEIDRMLHDLKQGFADTMDDDLNISEAFSIIFKFIRKTNRLITDGLLDRSGSDLIIDVLKTIDDILQVFDFKTPELAPELTALLEKRDRARSEKDWTRADQIRDLLKDRGYRVKDTPQGPVLSRC